MATNTMIKAGTVELQKELFDRWLNYLDARPKTIQTYSRAIRQFLLWLIAEDNRRPQREDILRYRDELLKKHKATTAQSYLAAVKQFFKWTGLQGIYPDICVHIKGVQIDAGFKRDHLTAHQCSKLMKSIDRKNPRGLRDYAILAVMLTTGVRTVEIQRANVRDLAVSGGGTVLYVQGKGHDDRNSYVKLGPYAEDAVREYLATRRNFKPDDPLFVSMANRNMDGRMTTRSITRIVKGRMIGANLISERWTAHSCRHTAATLGLLSGSTIAEIQQMLRHASINTSLLYSHALERERNDSEIRIGRAIFEA